jgi:carboxyl-terminal processing protease
MKLSDSTAKTAIGAVFFSLLIFGAGFYYGNVHEQQYGNNASFLPAQSVAAEDVDFSIFWEAWNVLNEKFVSRTSSSTESLTTPDRERVYGAIQGMTRALGDPYTTFLPPTENEVFSENISGEFGGVGMEVGLRDGILTIISPLKGTPAERAGLKPGDKVLAIDSDTTENLSLQAAVQKIRGKVGTEVILTILSENGQSPEEVAVERDTIQVPTIETTLQDDAFIIALYNFSAQSPRLFREALKEFKASGKENLIVDLRGNAGGFLQAAVEISSYFIDEGKVIVREDFGDKRDPQVYRSKSYDLLPSDINVAVLVNGGSASAAEIVAGALRDHGVAQLVGTQTFGKGSVQELVQLSEETALKVTVARWMTPNNVSISDGGLTPDIVVEPAEDETTETDLQLNRAVQLLE